MSVRRLAPCLALAALALAALAPPAGADEVLVAVERAVPRGRPVPLTVESDVTGRVRVRAWRIGHPEALLDAGVGLDRGLAWLVPGSGVPVTAAQEALRRAAALEPVLDGHEAALEAGKRRTVDVPLGAPGLYVLAVGRDGLEAVTTALVSDLGLVVKRWRGGLLAWAVERTSGEPQADVEIELRAGDRLLARAATDADGMARFALDLPPTVDVRAHHEGHDAYGTVTSHGAVARGHRLWMHTHQPAYRPGERVEVRGILRAFEGGRYRIDGDVTRVTLRLERPDGQATEGVEVPVSRDLGTFATGFDLDEDVPTGRWQVLAEVDGRTWQAPLVVDAYRRPAFEVRVAPAAPRAPLGAPLRFDVVAGFYDGGALAGAPVTWSLVYQRMDQDLFPEDELVRLFFGTEREAYRPEPLAQGEGRLDEEGRLVLETAAPADRPNGTVTLQAVVVGPDRTAAVGSGRVALVAAPLLVGIQTDRHLYGPEDVVRVTVRAETASGDPAADRAGVLTVALAPEEGGAEERWLHTLPFRTDAEGMATLEAPLAGAGRHLLAVALPRAADDPPGPPAHAQVHVWAVGETATPGYGSSFRVVADRDAYAVGDTARLLALPAGPARPVLACLEGDGLFAARVLRPRDGAPTWSVPLTEDHVPDVHATFVTVADGTVATATRVLRIPPRSRLLGVRVRPDAAEVEPGARSGYEVLVTDADGRPVADAEVDVAVVDEALLALHPDPAAPLEAFFHPPRRNGVSTEPLLDWVSVGYARLVPPPAAEGELADGMPARGGGGRGGAFRAPGAAAGPPAPAAPAPMPAAADPAAPPEEPPVADPVERLRGLEEAAEAGTEVHQTGGDDADGYGYLAGASKDKEDGRLDAIEARSDFRAAIHWSPALRTGPDGRARVDELVYGDSLTRWRFTAHAVDAATRVGRGTATSRTRRNVAAGVTLPRFLRAGDLVRAPVLLRNLTREALSAAWALVASGAVETVDERGEAALPAGGVLRVERELRAKAPGEATVRAAVASDAGTDAETRTLPVLAQGIEKAEGTTVVTTGAEVVVEVRVPRGAEPGTITGRVTVEPAFAQAMLAALPYLKGYPYGCTEQTMSRFVPLLSASEALAALGAEPPGAREEIAAMVKAGLARLAVLQHDDGGFGWWENDATNPAMTALVVQGLVRLLALEPEHDAARALAGAAAAHLAARLAQDERLDEATEAEALLAVAQARALGLVPGPEAGAEDALAVLLADRVRGAGRASDLACALLLRTAIRLDRPQEVARLRARLEPSLLAPLVDRRSPEGPSRWQDDPIETRAVVLLALLEAGSDRTPLAAGVLSLLGDRVAGDRWRSTRDTARAVELLSAFTKATGDLGAGRAVRVTVDGTLAWEETLDRERILAGTPGFELDPERLVPGAVLRIGLAADDGVATAAVALRYHETGPAIAAARHGFTVTRRFYRLDRAPDAPAGTGWTRTPVVETVPAGTLVEVELEVTTDADREYVMVVSPHVAGFEPWRETAMAVAGREAAADARVDGRDDRTVFFLAKMGAGRVVLRHTMRATHVGAYTALPAQAELMYFPDVRGSSDGGVWEVSEAGEAGREEGR